MTKKLTLNQKLLKEAKKHKTAIAFIKSVGIIAYHASDSKSIKGYNPKKAEKGEQYFNPLGNGLYLSTNREFVKMFGANIFEYVIPKYFIKKVIHYNNFQTLYHSVIKKTLSVFKIKYDVDTLGYDNIIEINRLGNNEPITAFNEAEEYIHYILLPEFNINTKPNQVKDIMQSIVDKINSKYDVVFYKDTNYYEEADEIVVIPKMVKYLLKVSELKSIWQQAHRGKK